jgi:DNA invertase Pin-like site-specific DNA recombinase
LRTWFYRSYLGWHKKNEIAFEKRQREGIDNALKNGIAFGRPKVQITDDFKEMYSRWKAGEMTAFKAMEKIDLKKTTFYRLVKQYESDLKSVYIIEETRQKCCLCSLKQGISLLDVSV